MPAAGTTVVGAPDVTGLVVGFARTLRHAGVDASPGRVQAMLAALGQLDVLRGGDVYWAGRCTLCAGPDDIDRYDAAFAAYFGGAVARRSNPAPGPVRATVTAALGVDEPSVGDNGDPAELRRGLASGREVLRWRDVAGLSTAERARLRRLFALLRPDPPARRSRRRTPRRRGEVDIVRTVRRALRGGGEVVTLARRQAASRPRRLVLLVDVSGSMAPYADTLLRFAHTVVARHPTGAEVFTVGTRLTRITRALRVRDPDRALAASGQVIPDWSGGTRLGEVLKAFLDRWGQRGTARGAVVLVCSDGWERGDAALLGEQMARLARLAHRVVWCNPHKGKAGFAPLTAGMQAALPHVDDFVAGHSMAALQDLVEVLGRA